MSKNRGFVRNVGPQGPVGIPPGVQVGTPREVPGVPVAPNGLPPEAMAGLPPGSSVTEMSEADGLKFHNLKLEEQVLSEQAKKLEADEQVIKVAKENLELRRQIVLNKTRDFYRAVGIESVDHISMRNGKFYRIRPPSQPKPGEVRKPPDLKIVRDEKGKEAIVPMDSEPKDTPEPAAPTPSPEPPPAPAQQ